MTSSVHGLLARRTVSAQNRAELSWASRSLPRRLAQASLVLAAAAACGSTHPGAVPSLNSSETRPSSEILPRFATTTRPPGLPQFGLNYGVSHGNFYLVRKDTADGASPDGHGHWHTQTAQLAREHDRTGDPAVIAAFNTASIAATQGALDQARAEAASGQAWNVDVRSAVDFLLNAVSDVVVGTFYAARAAHPVGYVATIVIDSRTAQPITLATLFRDENAGLQRLSEQTELIWPTVYGHGSTSPMSDEPGNQPREANFANWIPTAAGIEIHFRDYQLGPGLPVITVPWPALTDVLAPDMAALAQH